MFARILNEGRKAIGLGVVLVVTSLASAAPLTNQIVPIAVYQGVPGSFGLAYNSNTMRMGSMPVGGNAFHTIRAFNTYTPAELAAFPTGANGYIISAAASTLTTSTSPIGGPQALGFDSASGNFVIHNPATQRLVTFAPGGPILNANFFSPVTVQNGSAGFLDGLDVQGADIYYSAEPASSGQDSQRNGATFLNNTNAAQTNLTGAWTGPGSPTITRWAGIEAIETNGNIYTVAEVGGGAGRTIAVYDALGNLIAIDPDGSPFALRLEDLAFDGRYLYGTDFNTNQVFVFDIVGAGGIQQTVPEPLSVALFGGAVAGAVGLARRRRKAA